MVVLMEMREVAKRHVNGFFLDSWRGDIGRDTNGAIINETIVTATEVFAFTCNNVTYEIRPASSNRSATLNSTQNRMPRRPGTIEASDVSQVPRPHFSILHLHILMGMLHLKHLSRFEDPTLEMQAERLKKIHILE